MNLEDFKDIYKDKSPVEKLRLLVDAVELVERCRHGGGDEEYLAREREGQKDRANWLYSEIVKVLDAQEPTIMEPEELAALAMDESDNVPVWYEYRIITDRGVITRLEASVLWWVEDGWWRRLGPVRMGWEDVRADGYGVSWRVWTERPTDEQREAVAWE